MAFIGQSLKTSALPQDTNSFTPLPAGWYDVSVKASDLKATKAGDGSYINLQLSVTGPTHAGRNLWAKLNITNRNPKAEEIGRAQLRTICEIGGIDEISDTDQLLNLRMSVKVVIADNYQGEPDNEVKGFKACAGLATMPAQFGTVPAFAAPAQPQAPAFAQQAQPVAQATTAAPPWAAPAAPAQAAPVAPAGGPPWAARG